MNEKLVELAAIQFLLGVLCTFCVLLTNPPGDLLDIGAALLLFIYIFKVNFHTIDTPF